MSYHQQHKNQKQNNHYKSHDPKAKVLFILKQREDMGLCESYSEKGMSTGLLNSATFVHDMLLSRKIDSKLVVVVDNNDIDREVNLYKPTHVIIEALWVVPEKFEVLTRLHPSVKWIVRFHSETPFIAGEGIAMSWALKYVKYHNVFLGINAPRYLDEMVGILTAAGYCEDEIDHKVIYLPNYYPMPAHYIKHKASFDKEHVDIGCFGAIRPLKNQLLQAIAAIKFANFIQKPLHFHINTGRIEMKGDPILNNLVGLFEGLADQGHKLVVHRWAPHDKFIDIIKGIDIGMQVSFSETFNIVAADMITSGVPIVVSNEVPWAVTGIADPTDSSDITERLITTYLNGKLNVEYNITGLQQYVNDSIPYWVNLLEPK